MPHGTRRTVLPVTVALALLGLAAVPASGHGFSSTVYADVTAAEPGHVRTELGLEYDLLVVSAADSQGADLLFQDGTAALEAGDPAAQAAALEDHIGAVLAYVDDRYVVESAGERCTPAVDEPITVSERDGVQYTVLVLDHACPASDGAHEITSRLFADDEGYVTGTETILTYTLDGQAGSAALGPRGASFSTAQSPLERFGAFFRLGAEHLLGGLDHLLFLVALVAGSRRLREVVLAATAFTLAHTVTFVLAATGAVAVPARVVEPTIALSIAVVAGWPLWRARRGGDPVDVPDVGGGHLHLDRAGRVRMGVVFGFGLMHGLGFAGALGIDEPWSWTLLWSLLVFNLGVESVQLVLIGAAFPLLVLVRRRAPAVGRWATTTIAGTVAAAGLLWFVQRLVSG